MNKSQKILICGFPHCGTSILKSIIIRNSKSKPLITASDLLQSMLELDPKNRISLKELNQLLKKFK